MPFSRQSPVTDQGLHLSPIENTYKSYNHQHTKYVQLSFPKFFLPFFKLLYCTQKQESHEPPAGRNKRISNKCVTVQWSMGSLDAYGLYCSVGRRSDSDIVPLPARQRSAQQSMAGFCWDGSGGRGSNQQAEDWGRGMARSFLRPPFM